jgi:acyl-CoA thioesterase-1
MNPLKLALVLILIIFTECSYSASHTNKILIMGDSLSAGYGIRVEEGWVHLMQRELQLKLEAQVINASVSGETSSGGRARLPALLREHQPDILILELGGNDGLRGQPLKLLDENLQAMVDAGKQAGAQVLLIGMQITGNYGTRYTSLFKEIYPKISVKNQLVLVPFLLEGVATKPEWMQEDRIHPTAKAQATVMNNVLPLLRPMLRKK